MENKFEQPSVIKSKESVLERTKIREFIQRRDVRNEDHFLIEKLAEFPRNLIIMELHNLFNMNKEGSGKWLENLIKNSGNEERKAMYTVALEFYNKYDWMTSMDLVRVLESKD